MKVDITVDIEPALKVVQQELPRAVPYVAASMLSKLAFKTQERVKAEMPRVFDRPTPFAVKGVQNTGAKAGNLEAAVFFPRSQEAGGREQYEFMRPGSFGAARRSQKKSEYLLRKFGYLPLGYVSAPGSYGRKRLDQYGNIPGSIYRQIIRSLELEASARTGKSVSAASRKRAVRAGVDREWFGVPVGASSNRLSLNGGRLPAGVYQRVGSGGQVKSLRQWLVFTSKASYKKRLDLEMIAKGVVSENLEAVFNESFQSVLKGFARNTR